MGLKQETGEQHIQEPWKTKNTHRKDYKGEGRNKRAKQFQSKSLN